MAPLPPWWPKIELKKDLQTFNFLQQFIYDQHRQPRKKDIVYNYDMDEEDFAKVKILSRSNYRYYYNIRFLELERPDTGIYL